MERLTKKLPVGEGFILDPERITKVSLEYTGEAVEKLARFEDFYDDLLASQDLIARELDKLRSEGKEKSTKFRELFTKKLMNNSILILLKSYGLE